MKLAPAQLFQFRSLSARLKTTLLLNRELLLLYLALPFPFCHSLRYSVVFIIYLLLHLVGQLLSHSLRVILEGSVNKHKEFRETAGRCSEHNFQLMRLVK